MKPIIIIGAGIGGLSAAIRLARAGLPVHIIEARAAAGGLASGIDIDGFSFDAGPYILLDKPGLDWAFQQLGISAECLPLIPIHEVYSVQDEQGGVTAFYKDIERTAAGFEQHFAGSGARYRQFVEDTFSTHQRMKSLTFKSRPNPLDVLRKGLIGEVPFLLSSLRRVLSQTGLPPAVTRAISIWTHIAGQDTGEAPSAMAFVPGLFHNIGSYYPEGGMRAVGELLTTVAREAGVQFTFGRKVKSIESAGGAITGVQLEDGESITADYVISNASGVGTYVELLKELPQEQKRAVEKLPLQSPGMCIYLAVRGKGPGHYIRFLLKEDSCVAFVQPGLLDDTIGQEGWYPARLIVPLDHDKASALGMAGQELAMEEMLHEQWWQDGIEDYKVLHKRTTYEWGRDYNLYRDSMNPVMTRKFMLKGRMAHKSREMKGLYLAGSSTHPGQWVSFCAISGVLAADMLLKDAAHNA